MLVIWIHHPNLYFKCNVFETATICRFHALFLYVQLSLLSISHVHSSFEKGFRQPKTKDLRNKLALATNWILVKVWFPNMKYIFKLLHTALACQVLDHHALGFPTLSWDATPPLGPWNAGTAALQ